MECVGPLVSCCCVSFRLRLNIGRELNTLMLMAFLVNAANACGRPVQCPHRRGRPEAPVRHQLCWINHLPLPPWEIQWMLTFCLNCLVKRGSRLVRHQLGQTVLDYPRSCDHGSCNLEINRLIRTIVPGAAERHRRRLHSWWFLSVHAEVLLSDIMIPYSTFGCFQDSLPPAEQSLLVWSLRGCLVLYR